MKTLLSKPLVYLALFLFFVHPLQAQHRIKAGIGSALISNEGDHPAFNTFVAPTLYLSYAYAVAPKLKIGVENFLMLRLKERENTRRDGFAAALPVVITYQLPKVNFHAGAGPAYVEQKLTNHPSWGSGKIAGYYIDVTAGAGFRKRRLFDTLEMEYNLRCHYLKTLTTSRTDGIMLSLVVAFSGSE